MVVEEAVIIAGIGCRKGASATQVGEAIAAALACAGVSGEVLGLIATAVFKGAEPGIVAAANALSLPLVLVPADDLESVAPRTITHSERVVALTGVPSVAEAAALAAGGPSARLLAPRIAVGPVTCALATSELAT
jgi:cobalt-precorrin 5A hydrolase